MRNHVPRVRHAGPGEGGGVGAVVGSGKRKDRKGNGCEFC